MKLVIKTLPTFFVEEDKILTALFDEGMDSLHLCKPGASPMYSERLLSLLPEDAYGKITVHDHYYLKNCNDISTLAAMKKKAEYVFLAGVFGGKGDAALPRDVLEKAADLGLIDKHVYAYGGVGLDNIKEARELGFGGVVVCGDLWSKFDIHNELDYKDLINHFEKLKKATA